MVRGKKGISQTPFEFFAAVGERFVNLEKFKGK